MESGALLGAAVVAGAAIVLCDRVRRRRLRARARSSEFDISHGRAPEDALAARIVFESIARCFGISPHQVRLDDDINRDFRGPFPLDTLTLDDPGEEIIETIKDRVAQAFRPWEPTTQNSRVGDIIDDLSRHLANATSGEHSRYPTNPPTVSEGKPRTPIR